MDQTGRTSIDGDPAATEKDPYLADIIAQLNSGTLAEAPRRTDLVHVGPSSEAGPDVPRTLARNVLDFAWDRFRYTRSGKAVAVGATVLTLFVGKHYACSSAGESLRAPSTQAAAARLNHSGSKAGAAAPVAQLNECAYIAHTDNHTVTLQTTDDGGQVCSPIAHSEFLSPEQDGCINIGPPDADSQAAKFRTVYNGNPLPVAVKESPSGDVMLCPTDRIKQVVVTKP